MQTVEYARGRLADLFGAPAQPTVLLWHGRQTDARAAVRPLAELLAGHGVGVVVPDWNSHAADGGRADLVRSVRFARELVEDRDGVVLVGWSLGGAAAAAMTIQAPRLGVRFSHTVCLAGAFMVGDPISGAQLAVQPPGTDPAPFTLLHGAADDVVPVAASRTFARSLTQNGWPVELVELPTDHGGIAGATYDRAADRYRAAEDPGTLAIAADVANRIAAVTATG